MAPVERRPIEVISSVVQRHQWVPSLVLCLLLALYLGFLWVLRGDHVAGWELLGPAQGKSLLEENGALETLARLWHASRDFVHWNPTNSVLYAFFPGWLSSVAPWLYWAQVFNLLLVVVTVLLASRLSINRAALIAAIGASPALLSYCIVGYPYISGALPYVLALLLVYATRSRSDALLAAEVVAWLAVLELSIHCYELGKTFFVVPLLATISLSKVSWKRRALWVLASLGAAWFAFSLGKANVDYIVREPLEKLARLPVGLVALFRQLFVDWFLDGPALAAVGAVSCLWVRRDRLFWRLGFLAQLGLLVLGVVQSETLEDYLRPRRTLLFLFWTAILVAWTWRDASRSKRVVLASLIAAGWVFAAYSGLRFWRDPSVRFWRDPTHAFAQSLPYTYSQADFFVDQALVSDAAKLKALIDLGHEEHFVFYGYDYLPENTTDPVGVLERIYLQLPHSVFADRVLFVDRRACRYSCVPRVHPDAAIDRLREARPPFYVHAYRGYYDYDRNVPGRFLGDSDTAPVVAPELQRFRSVLVNKYRPPEAVTVEPLGRSVLSHASLEEGLCLWIQPDLLEVRSLASLSLEQIRDVSMRRIELPVLQRLWKPALYYFEGSVTNPEERLVTIETRVDDELVLLINGQAVVDLPGPKPEVRRVTRVRLPAGTSRLQGYYSNLGGIGVLGMSARFDDGRLVPWHCGVGSDPEGHARRPGVPEDPSAVGKQGG